MGSLLFQHTWLVSNSGRIHTQLRPTPMCAVDDWVNSSILVGSTPKPTDWLTPLSFVRPTLAPVQMLLAIASQKERKGIRRNPTLKLGGGKHLQFQC